MPTDLIMPDFMWRALFAGIGVAILAGPLGAFVVWRRMAYFGEALAHSALLGVVLGVVLGVMPWVVIIPLCVLVALALFLLERGARTTLDSAIALIAHGALAIGLVVLAFVETARVDLFAYLFGDILAVTTQDLWLIFIGGVLVLGVLVAYWQPLLSIIVNEDVAHVEGVNVTRAKIVHLLLLAVVVAVAMKVVGVLLIVALLIIPASTARQIARSPESMAIIAALCGVLSVIGGLWMSYRADTPGGPSIVVSAIILFVLALMFGKLLRSRH